MRPWLLLAILLAACGGTHPAPQESNPRVAPDAAVGSIHSSQYGCVLQPDQDPAACAQQAPGCSLGPPVWCSGVAPPEGWQDERADEPCACTCPADIARCAEVP